MHRILAVNADAVAAVPERPDRRRRPGRDDFRQLGRRAGRWCFQQFSLEYTAACWRSSSAPAWMARTCRASVFTKGGGIWLDDMKDIDCEVLGLDWTANLGKAAPSWVGGGWPRQGAAGQHRPERAVRPACADREPGACRARQLWRAAPTAPRPAHAHLQPGPRHQPVHRPSMWRRWSRPCTATRAQRQR